MLKHLTLILLSLSLLTSCNWDDESDITPSLLVAGDDFKITEVFSADRITADFTSEEVSFSGKFNQIVSWQLTIEGTQSGAIRQFVGESNQIDASVMWAGETDGAITNPRLFLKEECVARLEILGLNDILMDTITITETKEYGFLFGDFENASTALSSPWFAPTTADVQDFIFVTVDSLTETWQGSHSMLLQGNDASNNYYIGNVGYNNIGAIPTATEDASELYFNVYVYGSGAESAAKLEIQFQEGDLENWLYQIPTTHTGWKFFAIPYSEFVKTQVSAFGNEKQDANNIRLMTILYSSVPSGQQIESRIDYPILTTGKPLFK